MIGNLIVRFKKGNDSEIYEDEFYIGLDDEANLEEYINSCIEDIVSKVSGEGLDTNEEVFDLEYFFEPMEEEDIDEELAYDWR